MMNLKIKNNMIIQDVINHLEKLAPLHYAEDFDNVGLLVGNKNDEVKGVLVTLDTLESVVDEAIENNCNLIVSFHPIIFKGLKKFAIPAIFSDEPMTLPFCDAGEQLSYRLDCDSGYGTTPTVISGFGVMAADWVIQSLVK